MGLAGPLGPGGRQAGAVVLAMLALSLLSACTGSDAPQVDAAAAAAEVETSGSIPGDIDGAAEVAPDSSVTTGNAAPTTTPRSNPPPFALVTRMAAPKSKASALLTGVHTTQHDGFERIVFDFAGAERPGYQVEWVEGSGAAEGTGQIIEVAGTSRLRIMFEPASGVDLETGDITYPGPDRIDDVHDGSTIREVVRTGDFEAVMTWVAGTTEVAPFRVFTLSQPTRVVVDVEVPPAR